MVSIEEKIVEIKRRIDETPHDSRDVVEKYHAQIISDLDSGDLIPVPGPAHRNLHQILWMKGYEIYNLLSPSDAPVNFIGSEQRERFDVWYACSYILKRKLTDWELGQVIVATRESLRIYRHPLEDLLKTDVLAAPITPQEL